MPAPFFLCLGLLTFCSGYPDVPLPAPLHLPLRSLPSPPTAGDRPSPPLKPYSALHEGEAGEPGPRGRWAETRQAPSHCCHEQLKLTLDLEMFPSPKALPALNYCLTCRLWAGPSRPQSSAGGLRLCRGRGIRRCRCSVQMSVLGSFTRYFQCIWIHDYKFT